jgi:hypothetical protein
VQRWEDISKRYNSIYEEAREKHKPIKVLIDFLNEIS